MLRLWCKARWSRSEGVQRHTLLITRAQVRATDTFVRVGCLFGPRPSRLAAGRVVRTSATATTHAEKPEESRTQRKRRSYPCHAQHPGADGRLDAVILLQCLVQSTLDDGVHCRHRDAGAENEDGHGRRAKGREKRSPTGKDGGDADQQRDGRGRECNDVQVEDGFAGVVVHVQTMAEGLGEVIVHVDACVVQPPDLDRVEPKVCFGAGAVGVGVIAVPATIVSKVDSVKVFQAQRLFGSLKGTAQDGLVVGVAIT